MNLMESVELALVSPEAFSIGINTHLKSGCDSWGDSQGWRVYCPNMWCTLAVRGKATLENFILSHQVLVLHELTHHLSGVEICWTENDSGAWDNFLVGVQSSSRRTK